MENGHDAGEHKTINLQFLVRALRGNPQAVLRSLHGFMEQYRDDMSMIAKGIGEKDHEAIKLYTHRMKSTVSLVRAYGAAAVLQQLEERSTSGHDIAGIHALYDTLVQVMDEVVLDVQKEISYYNSIKTS